MHKLRGNRGWASAELALLTPALVFLACVLGAVVTIAGDRAQLVLAAHNGALAAMRGETRESVRATATITLSSMKLSKVQIHRATLGAVSTVSVCVESKRSLPQPLATLAITWHECATSMTEP